MTGKVQGVSKSSQSAEEQLQSFIGKFEPEHQETIRAVRKALRKRFPTANELAYDNYNFFVIGYGAGERPSDWRLPTSSKRICSRSSERRRSVSVDTSLARPVRSSALNWQSCGRTRRES